MNPIISALAQRLASWKPCLPAALLLALAGPLCRADSVVVFNEVHYHPAGVADPSGEWIELRNQLAVDVDISGWSLSGGVGHTFPSGTILAAGGYLVVAATPAAISGALGPWTGKLSNSGEKLELLNNNRRVMDKLSYGTEGDWPVAADGGGPSLAKRGANLPSEDARSWVASRQAGGTPGADNFPLTEPPVTTRRVNADAVWKYLDTGTAPAAAWKNSAFDDTAWSEGGGTFHTGTAGLPTPATLGTSLPAGPTTFYFRRHFTFDGVPGTTSLLLRLLVDDGAAAYLNGTELVRVNLAAGAASSTTATVPRRSAPVFQEFSVPGTALISGDNVLAVEVHQAAVLPAYPAAVIASGPVAYWRLGETANPVGDLADLPAAPEQGRQDGAFAGFSAANLSSAGPRPGDLVNGLSLTGFEAANTAPNFQGNNDGGDDVLLLPGTGALDFASGKKFTFEAWVKGPSSQENDAGIFAKGNGGGGEQFALDLNGGVYRFYVRDSAAAATVAKSTLTPNNTWQHLVGVHDPALNIFALYVNGALAASGTPKATLLATTHDISVGARQIAADVYNLNFSGVMDEVALYNRALTAAEVSAHFQAAFAASGSGPDTADLFFTLELDTMETPVVAPLPSLVFNEIGGEGPAFGVELMNTAATPLELGGFVLARLAGAVRQDFIFSAQTLPSGGFLFEDSAALGWTVSEGDRIMLFTADGRPLEARVVKKTPRARWPNGSGDWLRPSAATPGLANAVSLQSGVVINEIFYQPPSPPLAATATTGQWIELWNRSGGAVDLGGWSLDGGVHFTFAAGTTLPANGFLVVAETPAALVGVSALGPWSGSLSQTSDHLILRDAAENPADEVTYFNGGHWPESAGGGGSSLELRDARADHNAAENWAASDETSKASWQTLTWRGPANLAIATEPTQWKEFNLALLDGPGEFLVDDVRVTDTTNSQQLIQNGDFNAGLAHWRVLGTHRLTRVEAEVGNPTNQVLHVVATGAGEYQGNQVESTFLNNTALVTGREYEVSLRVRWLSGGGRLNTRLYHNRLARTHNLAVVPSGGTPGLPNSRAAANLGPTYANLIHSPAVPAVGQAVTVSVSAADPDGVASLLLKYSVAGGAWQSAAMSSTDGKSFSANIPGQAAGALVQFYVEGKDTVLATSFCPVAGVDSRALYAVQDGQAAAGPSHKLRLVMTTTDANFMHANNNCLSNAFLGATIIADEKDIYYDAGARLKGSFVGRNVARVGFSLKFQPDRLFRGRHEKVAIDRSQHAAIAQGEIVAKHMAGHAGGIPNMYDDLGRFVHVLPTYTSSCQIRMTAYEKEYLDTQYPNGSDGQMYEYEVLRWATTTSDGTAEGIKLPSPGGSFANLDLQNLGDDEEAYRWCWLISNHRVDNNLKPAVAAGKLFSLTGPAFDTESQARLDVDQWLRALAFQSLVGPDDSIYTGGNFHNIRFFTRPDDGRMLFMPWDWDSVFRRSTSGTLTGTGNAAKVVTVTAHNQRRYLAHLHALVSTTFNTAYMTRWTQHYGAVAGEDYSGILTYIGNRSNYVLTQLPTATAFSAAAGTVSANGAVTLTGQAAIAVSSVQVNGIVFSPVWTSNTAWQITVPLALGNNSLTILGLDRNGAPLAGATAALNVTNPNAPNWPPVRINEWLAANGTYPDPADGATDDWIELQNPTASAVDLSGWSLSDLPDQPRLFVFPSGTTIPAGGFLLVWADGTPVQSTPGVPHANFKLSAGGETLLLTAPDGREVDRVTFGSQADDVSEGRAPGGGTTFSRLSQPTPATANVLLQTPLISSAGGEITLSFATTPGHTYRVETSADLITWTPQGGSQTATGTVISVTDALPEGGSKFYRAVLLP